MTKKLLPYFLLKAKPSPLLKDVRLFKRSSLHQKKGFFPKNFKLFSEALLPYRIGFKRFDFYSHFLGLTPHPFPSHNTYFRQQSRTFVFWYEFAARKYNITLDFGLKQKKTVTETVLWGRKTRRDSRAVTPWWSYIQRYSSFRFLARRRFFRLNDNSSHPLFPVPNFFPPRWFEESLPLFRRYARNFHSRLTAHRTNMVFLSQSIFHRQTLLRKAPLDATTLWLASPIHDYSAFLKNYTPNKTMILPERYFQFRQRLHHRRQYWTQILFRFWMNTFKVLTVLPVVFAFPSFSYYFKFRFWQKILASLSSVVYFHQWFAHKKLPVSSPSLSSAHWMSLVLPSASLRRKSPYTYRKVAFFVKRLFFYSHFRRQFDKFQRTFVTSLSVRNPLLKALWTKLFQMHAFNGPLLAHQLLTLWSTLVARRFLKFTVKVIVPKRKSKYPRRQRSVRQYSRQKRF